MSQCDDPRVEARIRSIRRTADNVHPTRPDRERFDRLVRECERDFALLTPGDRERLTAAIHRATGL